MKKKLLLAFSLLSLNIVLSQEFVDNGIKYNITSETTVEVIENDPIYSGDIVIPESVTDGGTTISYNVTAIGEEAFYECSSLTSISIPNTVNTLGNTSFKKCSSLTTILIPSSVSSIGEDVFSECSDLAV